MCFERANGCNQASILRLETALVGERLGFGPEEPVPLIDKLSEKEPVTGTNCILSLVAETVNLETP